MPLTNSTNVNFTTRQLKLPLEIEKLIDIADPVYTFCEVMEHIDLTPYFVDDKDYKTGRPRCDAQNQLFRLLSQNLKFKERYTLWCVYVFAPDKKDYHAKVIVLIILFLNTEATQYLT